ncbi:MAG: hypothetical protein KDK99_07800, partial [Verrucomicrobiales bacterium]|nr:hypothetical protein [Verrucomicrobiales bacterium]
MLARTTAATTVTSPEDSLTPGERQARIDGQAAMTAARNNLTPIARAVLDSAANPAPTTAKPTLVIAQNTTSE